MAGLNAVQPYDWAAHLNQRLHSTDPHAPLGGLERAGWKLVFDDVRSDFWKAVESDKKWVDLTYSLGLKVREDSTVADVRYGGPAQKAGVAPNTKLIAVNGRQFNPTLLRESVASGKPVDLLLKTGEYFETHHIDYRDKEKYPHLVRVNGTDDLLSQIIKAKVK